MSEPVRVLIVEDSPEPLAVTIQVLRLRGGFVYEIARKA
jgi:hypothetical protein